MLFVPGTAKFFTEIFLRNSLDDSGIFLFVYSSRTNLKLHSILVSLKTMKWVIPNLGSSKVSNTDCILLAVLNNCEPKFSYLLADLFNICMKGATFLLLHNK